ncbi:MAG TPA: hypothetical protein PK358_11495 [Spirochaetota bacterium]|nr:hypothetical protein [Spirochaetota bacterium]HPJ35453.1 hypothetical protein [Spirochaetota bacterium]
MNISTGLSEISFNRSNETAAVSKKAYIWPGYNAGKVNKVTRAPEFRGEPVYFKPTEEKKNEIMGLISNQEPAYNSAGKVQNTKPYVEPGSLFTAFA